MTKKSEVPKDFDLSKFLSGDEIELSKQKQPTESAKEAEKVERTITEKVDEKAIMESIANMNISEVIAKKKEQSQKAENTESTESGSIGIAIEETVVHKFAKKTIPSKQRKASLQEYQETFLSVPKITDRKTVFISNHLREKIVSIYRRLGSEKSSVSGFIENLVIHHLEEYKEDIESWKKL